MVSDSTPHSQGTVCRRRPRFAAWALLIQPLVGEIGEGDHALTDSEMSSTVFMDTRADIKRFWCDIFVVPTQFSLNNKK